MNGHDFIMDGYDCICVPRKEIAFYDRKSYRMHGVLCFVCSFFWFSIAKGINVFKFDDNVFFNQIRQIIL